MSRRIYVMVSAALAAMCVNAAGIIEVPLCDGDATEAIQAAIEKAASYKGKPVTLRLSPGNYHISREKGSRFLYHISNTASAEENPDQTKHIGLWLRGMKNVTIDGNGAWLVTHGEMTSFVIDSCENITLRNFTLTSADPSVPEFKVLSVDRNSMTVEITPPTQFEISESGEFRFKGEGWSFAEGAHATTYPEFAQVFYPESNVTLRCETPLQGRKWARRIGERIVQFGYDHAPDVHVGEIYQLRHGIRNQACGFINMSRDIRIEDAELNFLGNFGLVGQYSENITYDNIRCRPRLGSGRTDAGFADFVQMSGCKGKIRIANSYFEGAHDDPINIHGTHLKAVASDAPDRLTVRFMHGQSYGFTPFFKGDKVEIMDRHSLNCITPATVKSVRKIDDYEFELTFDRVVPALKEGYPIDDIAVENVTWTPEVEIVNNYFARIPTRGILITTRGKSLIEDNTFFRMPMPSVLVSDDARGWYESGPVHDLTIRRNTFIECGSPMIAIWPEYDRFDRPIHRNIEVVDNRFIMKKEETAISMRGVEDITVRGNVFDMPQADSGVSAESLIESKDTSGLKIYDNKVVATP